MSNITDAFQMHHAIIITYKHINWFSGGKKTFTTAGNSEDSPLENLRKAVRYNFPLFKSLQVGICSAETEHHDRSGLEWL